MILDMPVPEQLESLTDDTEEVNARDKSIVWKLKAEAARISFRLFSKYANLRYVQTEDPERPWHEFFQQNFAETLCESHLQIMFKKKTHFVGSKTLSFVIKMISSASKIDVTMAKMLPFMDTILYETIIPLMLSTNRDIKMFQDDPVEFIRKQQDIMETMYMPKLTASTLLQLIC